MAVDVAVRLALGGGESVARGFNQIGREGSSALRDVRGEASKLPPSLIAVSRSVRLVRDQVDDLADRAGPAGTVLRGMGPAGLAAAAGMAAMGAAAVAVVNHVRDAAQAADDLVASAERIGVGVEALQELRHAAEASDVSVQDLDAGLEGLNKALGAVKQGVGDAKVSAAFQAMGFSKEQIKGYADVSELLPDLADKVRALGDSGSQTKLLAAVGGEALAPMLRQGSQAMEEMRQQARDLGIVMGTDVAENAAAANEELRVAGEVIRMNLLIAFAELAPQVANAAGEIAAWIPALKEWIREAGQFASEVSGIFARLDRGYGRAANIAAEAGRALGKGTGIHATRNWFQEQQESSARGAERLKTGFGYDPRRVRRNRAPRPAPYIDPKDDNLFGTNARPDPDEAGAAKDDWAKPKPARAGKAAKAPKAAKARAAPKYTGPSIDDLEARATLDLARAQDDDVQVEKLQDAAALKAKIEAYDKAGMTTAAARTKADAEIAALQADRAADRERETVALREQTEIEIARLTGDVQRAQVLADREERTKRIAEYEKANPLNKDAARSEANAAQDRAEARRAQTRAKELAAMQSAVALTVAQSREDWAGVEIIERRVELDELRAKWAGKGKDTAEDERLVQAELVSLDESRLRLRQRNVQAAAAEHAIRLAELRGDRSEVARLQREDAVSRRAGQIAQENQTTPESARREAERLEGELDTADLQGQVREAFRGGMGAAFESLTEGNGDALSRWVDDWFSRGLERGLDQLTDALMTFLQKLADSRDGGGGTGWQALLDAGLSAFRSPSAAGSSGAGSPPASAVRPERAEGGPTYRGLTYRVEEEGPESLMRASSDGFMRDAAATARELSMAREKPAVSRGADGGETPISVNIESPAGLPLRGEASERRRPDGGREVRIRLQEMVDAAADRRVRELTDGGRDDRRLGANFGLRRPLSGG